MYRKLLFALLSGALVCMSAGCAKKQGDQKVASQTATAEQQNAMSQPSAPQKGMVCVVEGTPVRSTPARSGKVISTLSLGETVESMQNSQTDAADKNREYLQVRLSDGKEGWAPAYGLLTNAIVGATKEQAIIYKRPDVLTMTPDKFMPLDIVALGEEKDDWIQAVGEQRKKNGWIKKEFVTVTKEDVALAALAIKKFAEKDGKSLPEKIQDLLANSPYPNSFFMEKLRGMAASSMQAADSSAQQQQSALPPASGDSVQKAEVPQN
jgi:hypothetical protein